MVLKGDSTTHSPDVDADAKEKSFSSYVRIVPTKRRSRGRSKGQKGRSGYVQCGSCGQLVPRDKAEKMTHRVSLVNPALSKELRHKGAYFPTRVATKYYCVSCAVHRGIVKVRSKDSRKASRRR